MISPSIRMGRRQARCHEIVKKTRTMGGLFVGAFNSRDELCLYGYTHRRPRTAVLHVCAARVIKTSTHDEAGLGTGCMHGKKILRGRVVKPPPCAPDVDACRVELLRI